jgi:hypothetical protein
MRNGSEAVRQSIDESLARLKTNYIDLLLIHWPVKDRVRDTWQVMEDYVRQGKVRSIGVSNFNRHHLDDLLSYAEIRPAVNQIEVHPLMTQEENIAYNQSLGIQVEAWGPFGQGDIDVIGHPLLQSLAAKYQKTASQIVLRWIIQRDLITIPRAKPNHFKENLDIMAFSLSNDDMQAISALNQNLRSNALNDPETFPWCYRLLGRHYALRYLEATNPQLAEVCRQKLAAAGLDKGGPVSSKLTIETKRSGETLSVVASEPVEKVDVVGFSGQTVKTFTLGGKKEFELTLKGLPKEKLVLVFQSVNGKATTDINLQ